MSADVVKAVRGAKRAMVEVVAQDGDSLRPISIVFEDGDFAGTWVAGDLDDSDTGADLEAWVEANGDECWASLEDHRGGPTLSLRRLAERAMVASYGTE